MSRIKWISHYPVSTIANKDTGSSSARHGRLCNARTRTVAARYARHGCSWVSKILLTALHFMTLLLLFNPVFATDGSSRQRQPSQHELSDAGRHTIERVSSFDHTTMSVNRRSRSSNNNLPVLQNSASQNALASSSKGSLISSLMGPRSIDDWQVADFILVCSIDGSLHARDRQTGLEIWSIPGERPLVQVSAANVSSNLASRFSECEEADRECLERNLIWIVEPLGEGSLYYFTPKSGLQKLPISIKELVLQSPFALHSDDKIYTGSRHTTLFSIDSATGKVLKVYGSGKSDLGNAKCRLSQRSPLDTDYDDYEDYYVADKGSFLIGRTGKFNETLEKKCFFFFPNLADLLDYMLEIHGKNETIWNVTYSTWGPNSVDYDLVAQHYRSPDNIYVAPIYNNSILALSTDGRKKPAQWVGHISTVAISVFDVFRPLAEKDESAEDGDSLIILPQPWHYMEIDEKLESSVYVQQTSGKQWFAMSGEHYPSLVHGAPLAPWSRKNHNDFFSSIIGVHSKSPQQQQKNERRQQHNSVLAIDGPREAKRPSEVTRSPPPPPMALPPPVSDGQSTESKIYSSIIRIVENVFAFGIFFGVLVVAAKLGWFPQLVHILEILQATNNAITKGDDYTELEKIDEIPSILSNNSSDEEEVKKHVEIIEPEKSWRDDEEAQEDASQQSPPGSTPKRRKRGSRGGRSGKKKKQGANDWEVGDVTPTPSSMALSEMVKTSSSVTLSEMIKAPSNDLVQSSQLSVTDQVLGYGSHGTVVLKGEFESREVAVKRMLLEFYDVASHEVSLLQESDDHPNVIRYYCKQQSERFLYIALELCPGTLEDLVEKRDISSADGQLAQLASIVTPVQIMYQIASGVQHLHSLKIVHRDLKPQNILVAPPRALPGLKKTGDNKAKHGPVRMLISDFGLCKRLEGDQSSFRTTTAQAAGTSGWRAPELLLDEDGQNLSKDDTDRSWSEPLVIDTLSNRRATRAIDIFSLGCVFYYILSGGQHPFGDKILREANIVQNSANLDFLDNGIENGTVDDAVEARDLISRMISRNPRERPDANMVLLHPLFWSWTKRLDFLLKVSDRFEGESRDPPSELLVEFEQDAERVVGDDWHGKLGRQFVDNLGKYRKYHGDRILDLLRAMRNKSHHFNDMPAELKEKMGPYPEGYAKYFARRFPYLLTSIYYMVKRNLAEEDVFKPFFE